MKHIICRITMNKTLHTMTKFLKMQFQRGINYQKILIENLLII